MRKACKLLITESLEVFGVDPETNDVLLYQEDFRDSFISLIDQGKVLDGAIFEVDVDSTDNFIRRPNDNTVKVHKPYGKKYSTEEVRQYCQFCIDKIGLGETINLETLVK